MESFCLEISSRASGSLLQNKTFVPIDGPVLSITNSSPYKSISFVRATWSKTGSKIAACDCHGNLYVIDFNKSRFYLAHHFNTCSTCIVFSSENEIIVALADCNIEVINLEKNAVRNKFNFHTSSVICISFNKNRQVLSASKNEAILWDLTSFTILRVLTLKKDVDIIKVFFLPHKDIIVSAFKDSSVFLWQAKYFTCIRQFSCHDGKELMNLKAVDCSWDEELIACAGKNNWFIIWSVTEDKCVYNVSLPGNTFVKQIRFLSSVEFPETEKKYMVSLLTSESNICIYNLNEMELLHTIKSADNKIISYAANSSKFTLLTTCLQGNLDVYDIGPFLIHTDKKKSQADALQKLAKNVPQISARISKVSGKEMRKKKKASVEVNKNSLRSMVRNYEEFPERYRLFIWSQLLELPHNVDAFKVFHQDSLTANQFVKEYSFMNPGVQKTFIRIMSMLACWFPVIREMEYFQCVAFPFVKVLHKNPIMCFEILVTYISNWCQNWFIFAPFPPFNILCLIENILVHHDPKLVAHFTKYNISSEVYGWPLLQTSFSEVFNKHQWFKLWDNIFANPMSFLLYAVAAFNIIMRDVLFQCKTTDNFKQCYRKHGVSASVLIQKTYELQKISPSEISPDSVIGNFNPIPKGSYPSFMQTAEIKVDFQTRVQKSLLDQEINYLKDKTNAFEIKGNYLLELQKLQLLRRKLLLENTDIKDSEALDALARKLKNVQKLVQDNLTDQISMLRDKIGYDSMFGAEDYHLQFFKFKDYLKKLKKDKIL